MGDREIRLPVWSVTCPYDRCSWFAESTSVSTLRGEWAEHVEEGDHGCGATMPRRRRLSAAEETAIDAIILAKRVVMQIAGGNLDHPALDHLDRAEAAVAFVELQSQPNV